MGQNEESPSSTGVRVMNQHLKGTPQKSMFNTMGILNDNNYTLFSVGTTKSVTSGDFLFLINKYIPFSA
jgi:hypothetical protein